VFEAYAQRKGVVLSQLEFSFIGVALDGDLTCVHYNIGDQDVIDAEVMASKSYAIQSVGRDEKVYHVKEVSETDMQAVLAKYASCDGVPVGCLAFAAASVVFVPTWTVGEFSRALARTMPVVAQQQPCPTMSVLTVWRALQGSVRQLHSSALCTSPFIAGTIATAQ
jgi:hypothetical protein